MQTPPAISIDLSLVRASESSNSLAGVGEAVGALLGGVGSEKIRIVRNGRLGATGSGRSAKLERSTTLYAGRFQHQQPHECFVGRQRGRSPRIAARVIVRLCGR